MKKRYKKQTVHNDKIVKRYKSDYPNRSHILSFNKKSKRFEIGWYYDEEFGRNKYTDYCCKSKKSALSEIKKRLRDEKSWIKASKRRKRK